MGEGARERPVYQVLMIDDDRDVRAMVVAMLGRQYRVMEAGDGATGLRLLGEHGADLVILDVTMPGLNGWEVCRRIKDDPATAGVPVLMLTVRSAVRDEMEMSLARPDGLLNKPFDRADLFGQVVRCLRAGG
jgi:DNA-binding response OmpR family regulator